MLLRQTSLAPGIAPSAGHPEPTVGAQIGRYVVTATPRRGGMGAVYQATDPELDRTVAIKLMRTDLRASAPRQTLHMLQEARALARIDHPNVLAIHDIGVWCDHVFIATAWVRGDTLGAWLQHRRTHAEVVAVFAQVARGLEAIHRAGLVHRDVKPANIMLDETGRARVLDLGLARAADRGCGELGGTLRYMAPEQRRGHADAASDQWALSLCLYEALCGSDELDRVLEELREGRVRWPSVRPRRRWRRAVQRGLSYDPSDRFGSLSELGSALEGRSTSAYTTGVVGALALGWLTVQVASAQSPRTCERMVGTFPEISDAIAAASVETAEARERIATELGAYRDRWAQAGETVCMATTRDDGARRVLGATACLQRSVRRVDGLLARWAQGDADATARALSAITELPAPESCLDIDDEPESPERPEIQRQLDRAAVALSAGDLEDAWEELAELPARAVATRDRKLQAEVFLLTGRAQYARGETAEAMRLLREARYAAEASASDRMAAEAALFLTRVVALHERDATRAEDLARMAEATIERLGDPPGLVAAFHRVESRRLGAAGDGTGALSAARRAHEHSRSVHGDDHHLTVVDAATLATQHAFSGDLDAALALMEPAVEWFRRNLGPGHVTTAQAESDLGNLYIRVGDPERAIPLQTKAAASLEAALGPLHTETGQAHYFAASALVHAGRLDEAWAHVDRSLAAFEHSYGPDSSKVAWTEYLRGTMAAAEGDHGRALGRLEPALATLEERLGEDHPALCSVLDAIGASLHAMGRDDDALAAIERSLGLQPPTDVEPIAANRIQLGEILLAQGSHAEAARMFEAAVSGLAHRPSAQSQQLLAEAQSGLSRARTPAL